MWSAADYLTEVEENINDAGNNYWSDATIIRQIDKAVKYVWGRIIAINPWYYQTYVDISTVANQESYDLPPNFAQPLEVRDIEGISADEHGERLHRGDWHWRHRNKRWSFNGLQFVLHEIPTSSTADKYRIHYVRSPAAITYGIAGSGGTTTLIMAATATYGTTSNQNDYYNNSRVLIVSGAGAGEIRTVSDYDGSTRTMTLNTGTAIDNTSVYSVLPEIPDYGSELVVLRATVKCLMMQDANSKLSFYKSEFREERVNFMRTLKDMHRSSPRMISETDGSINAS